MVVLKVRHVIPHNFFQSIITVSSDHVLQKGWFQVVAMYVQSNDIFFSVTCFAQMIEPNLFGQL